MEVTDKEINKIMISTINKWKYHEIGSGLGMAGAGGGQLWIRG